MKSPLKFIFLGLFLIASLRGRNCLEQVCLRSSHRDHCIFSDKKIQNESDIDNESDETSNEKLSAAMLELSSRDAEQEKNINVSVKWTYVPPSTINKINSSNNNFDQLPKLLRNGSSFVMDIAENSSLENEYTKTLSNHFLSFTQPFDASLSSSASQACRAHSQLYMRAVENFDLWALKMHDSSARLPSGILNGNINQFGDYDQCLSVNGPVDNLQGQYCLAYLQASVSSDKTPYLKSIHELVQSHGAFKSEFNDPGHRVPRFSLINWALCIPSSCSALDVEASLKQRMKNFTENTGISFQIRVEPRMCQINYSNQQLDVNTKLAIGFFTFVLAVCIFSTWYEVVTDKDVTNDWLVAFSLKKNSSRLFSTDSSPDDIGTVHGIRFLNAFMLLISHKSMAIFFNPYINRTSMTEMLGQPWTVIGRAASIYTDPFLLFSGMLTAYSLFGRLKRGQPIRLFSEYVGRLLRIVPTLGALILFCTYVLPILSSGPQWNLVVNHHSDICKKYWWRNLLFIHNYFGFGEMCLTHTHHLGIDTELFAFAPIAILGVWRWPRRGLSVLLVLAALSTAARFHTTITHRLSNYVYFGTTIQRLFRTADYMYSYPPHRSTVYILGIFLGYALRMHKDYKLSQSQLIWGWIGSTILFCGAFFGPAPMGDISYKYNAFHAAYYAAFAPIAWCAFFSWIVFTSHLGHKNKLTRILSWKGFQVTTKLSYAIYLTQFPVFFFNVGRKRNSDYYSFFPIMLDTNEYFCIFASSVMLTLLFDSPFQNIKKLIFSSPVRTVKSVKNMSIGSLNNNNNEPIELLPEKGNSTEIYETDVGKLKTF